jgi:hypothetical protein
MLDVVIFPRPHRAGGGHVRTWQRKENLPTYQTDAKDYCLIRPIEQNACMHMPFANG